MADGGTIDLNKLKQVVDVETILDKRKLNAVLKTLETSLSGENISKYFKGTDTLLDDLQEAYKKFNRSMSDTDAKNLVNINNILKALKVDTASLVPNFEEIGTVIEKAEQKSKGLRGIIKVQDFKDVFVALNQFKEYGLDIEEIFGKLGAKGNFSELSKQLEQQAQTIERYRNKVSALRDELRDAENASGVSDLRSKLNNLTDGAKETFEAFLKLNNIGRMDEWGYYDSSKFSEYFDAIENGSMSAQEAITKFKAEYGYLLENSFKNSNNTFGLEQLRIFQDTLDQVLTTVEDFHRKLDTLPDDMKNIQSSEKSGQVLFDEEQLKSVLNVFGDIKDHLSSLRSVISDVGDGEELSPLLKTIEKVSEAVSNLNMKFNMNIDVGSDNEMEQELQKKASNALLAYENLREHLFRTYRGDNYTSELLYKFDPSQFDTTIGKIEGYKKFIENLRASIKENYGHDKLYEDSDKSYWNKASAAYGQITKVRNAMKADSEGSPLDNLFGGKTDLTEVIEQLKLIVTELGNVSAAAAEIKTVLGNGIQVNDSLQQIETLTQKVKELETELTSLKSGTSLPSHSEVSEPTGIKKYQKKGYKAHDTGNHDNEKKVVNKKELGNALKELQSEIIANIDSANSFIKDVTDFYDSNDNLVKTQMKVLDKNGNMSTYTTSYSMDKDGNATAWTSHIDSQKFKDQNQSYQNQLKTIRELSAEKQKLQEQDRKSEVNQALKDQLYAYKQIQSIREKIANTDDESLISELTEQKKVYQEQYLSATKILKNNSDLYDSQKRLNELLQIGLKTTQQISEEEIKRNTKSDNSLEKQLQSMLKGLDDYEAKMRDFNKRKTEDRSSDYTQALTTYQKALNDYREELNKVKRSPELVDEAEIKKLKSMREELDKAATSFKGIEKGSSAISRDKLITRISDYMKKNTSMSKEFKGELEGLIQRLKALGANADVTNIADEFFKVSQRIREAGQEGKKFWDIVKEKAWYGLAGTIGTYFGLNDLIQYGKQAAQTVINLDTALVDLKKTTTMSSSQLKEFYFDANDVAKQMGVSTQQIIEQASAWSRLGFSTQQASTEMAKLSSQFASISPGMSTDNAQQGLVSIMKAWSIPVEDVKEEIMSNINQLGNTMAESNQDIVDGMERSAAALAAVGTSYKDAFALFSGMQEVLQSSEKAGTSLRSVALRLRSFDESTGEYSEDLQNITGKLIDLTKTAQHAQGVSVFKPGSTTEFKSLVDYFREIHDIWDEMSQKQQNDFLLQAFGRTQAQGGASLIKNFSAVEKALQEMEQSAGSSDREMQVVESSLEYKLNRLKETWVGTAQEIIDRGDLGIAIDGITKVSEALGFLIEKIGLVKIAGVGFLGFLGRDKLKQQFCPV